MIWNGTLRALIITSWYGQLDDGTPFKTKYTGIFPLDFCLSILVAFWFYGTNGSDAGSQLFLIDMLPITNSAYLWLYVESTRTCEKPSAISYPIIWGLLWQSFGAAFIIPVYYYNHLNWIDSKSMALPSIDSSSAKALPLSFALGAILAIMVILPTWIDRSPILHQDILAVWNVYPLWVSLAQIGAVAVFASSKKSKDKAVWWTRFSYLTAAMFSSLGHLYTAISMLISAEPSVGLVRMYVPFLPAGPQGAHEVLEFGPWLFLQYDNIIISFSSLSWAYILLDRSLAKDSSMRFRLPTTLLISSIVLGPGATVSLALFMRESALHQRSIAAQGLKEGIQSSKVE